MPAYDLTVTALYSPAHVHEFAEAYITGTDSLRTLEEDGIITRTVYPEVPPRVEYVLSELGESMRPIIKAMEAWGIAYKANRQ